MADLTVGVFVDYQNALHRAREAFGAAYSDPQAGQFHPVALGHLLATIEAGRALAKVHIYRGQPDPRHDPKSAGACQRQIKAWRDAGAEVKTRPVGGYQYGKPKEKGIDVLIALDFVMSALRRRYDVQVLVSADSDLLPALEQAHALSVGHAGQGRPPIQLETVAWMPPTGGARRLKTGGLPTTERAITAGGYRKIEDPRDYARRSPRP